MQFSLRMLFSIYQLPLYRIACFVLNLLTIHLLIFIIIGIMDLGHDVSTLIMQIVDSDHVRWLRSRPKK